MIPYSSKLKQLSDILQDTQGENKFLGCTDDPEVFSFQTVSPELNTGTNTSLDGLLKGHEGTLHEAVAGLDYVHPSDARLTDSRDPNPHNHEIADILALSDVLSGKADAVHTHEIYDVTGLASVLSDKAAASHSHEMSDVNGLASALSDKAAASHTHEMSDVNGLASALSDKAAASHTHEMSDVNGLASALSGKSNTGHTHTTLDVAGLGDTLDAKADLVGGVIPSSQLPALVKTDVFVVDSQSAMLALTAQSGDLAIRTDLSKTFVHNGGDTGTVSDWSELISPTDAVTSVNGLIGNVTLGYADVGAAAASHSHTLSDISGLLDELDGKSDVGHTHTISDITDLPVIAKSSTGNALVQANATGTINDSFLPTYLAKTNVANTFTKPQGFTVDSSNIASVWESSFGTKYTVLDIRAGDGANSRVAGIRLVDTATGANGRRWEFRKGDNNAFEFFFFNSTGGNSKPFSIDPDAPSNSFILKASGYAGFGTSAPIAKAHVHAGTDLPANVVDGPLAVLINAFPGGGTSDQYKDAIFGLGVSVPHVYLCGGASFSNNARGRFTIKMRTDGGGTFSDRLLLNYLGQLGLGTLSPSAMAHVVSVSASTVTNILQGATSQSANLKEFWNSAGTVLSAFSPAGSFLAPPGSAAGPSISFLLDPNTGFHNSNSNDTIGITVGGVQRGWFNSTGLFVESSPSGDNGCINARHSGGASLTFNNVGAGGGLWRWIATNDSYSLGGQKLYLVQHVVSTTDPIMMIATGRFGFGQGLTNPKATIHSNGSTILGAATSAVVDADMGNGQINPYIDETGNNLKIKVKYSNGTIRIATIPLVAP